MRLRLHQAVAKLFDLVQQPAVHSAARLRAALAGVLDERTLLLHRRPRWRDVCQPIENGPKLGVLRVLPMSASHHTCTSFFSCGLEPVAWGLSSWPGAGGLSSFAQAASVAAAPCRTEARAMAGPVWLSSRRKPRGCKAPRRQPKSFVSRPAADCVTTRACVNAATNIARWSARSSVLRNPVLSWQTR